MVFNSLLWLPDSIKHKIDARVTVDLGLHTIYQNLMAIVEQDDFIINELCLDEKTIYYRQGILREFMNTPGLLSDLTNGLKSILEINTRLNNGQSEGSQFYQLVNLVIQMETIIGCLEALQKTFRQYDVKSDGLKRLKEIIFNEVDMSSFKEMKSDLAEIKSILRKVKSVEVTANLSVEMRPLEVQITQINEDSYTSTEIFEGISNESISKQPFLGRMISEYNPVYELENMDWDILDDLAYSFKSKKDKFAKFIQTYQYLELKPYQVLIQQLTFYQGSIDFSNSLRRYGLPQCMPTLLKSNERRLEVKDFYNINIAFEKINSGEELTGENEVVLNDLTMNREGRILILTGANRGGKTTLTQAVGQVQVLAQLGLYIPASEAKLSLVDSIYTHFSVKENDTVDLGRLGKECQMFSDIFQRATEKSLLLLNESFSATSHLESLKIAEEAVMATKYKRMRLLFNTHLHELAMNVDQYNEAFNNDTPIVSLVIGNTFERHSFKVHKGEPLGKSFAKDEAKRYGVTYEQLTGKGEVNNYGKSNLQFVVVK